MIVTLEQQYFITLPADLVDSLGLKKGDKLHCLLKEQELRLRPMPSSAVDSPPRTTWFRPGHALSLLPRPLKYGASAN